MRRFFSNLDTLHKYTLNLDQHQEILQCPHCAQYGQFVSHGFVRKQKNQQQSIEVAKRIFCSNRSGRSGCGRTCQLYLAQTLPRLACGPPDRPLPNPFQQRSRTLRLLLPSLQALLKRLPGQPCQTYQLNQQIAFF